MRTPPPVEIRFAGINYRVEPLSAGDGGSAFIAALPLTATGELWAGQPAQLLSLDLVDATLAWTRGFTVNDHFFLPLSLVAKLLEDNFGEEVQGAHPDPILTS